MSPQACSSGTRRPGPNIRRNDLDFNYLLILSDTKVDKNSYENVPIYEEVKQIRFFFLGRKRKEKPLARKNNQTGNRVLRRRISEVWRVVRSFESPALSSLLFSSPPSQNPSARFRPHHRFLFLFD